jgi:hypothetical protein
MTSCVDPACCGASSAKRGFGTVWLVHDAALREEVALKFVQFVLQAVAASPEAVNALRAEAAGGLLSVLGLT